MDVLSAQRDGYKFFQSEGDHVQCVGNSDGGMPPKYFIEAQHLDSGQYITLDRSGGPTVVQSIQLEGSEWDTGGGVPGPYPEENNEEVALERAHRAELPNFDESGNVCWGKTEGGNIEPYPVGEDLPN